ncbi:hypothetical protein TNCV_1671561 [Trichonephila clavipes]|nr:hypothetical protein TNCV_1671561 [Trichonephila clavipes]
MIEAAVAGITIETLNKVWDELAYLIDMFRVANGTHIEYLKFVGKTVSVTLSFEYGFYFFHTIDTVKGHASFLPLAYGFVCVRFTLPNPLPFDSVKGYATLPFPLLADSFHPTAT